MSRVPNDDDYVDEKTKENEQNDVIGTMMMNQQKDIEHDPGETKDDSTTTDLEQQRRHLHALLESADPYWYQEYVLDILECPPDDCNYPAVLDHTLVSNNNSSNNNIQTNNITDIRKEGTTEASMVEGLDETSAFTATAQELQPMDSTIEATTIAPLLLTQEEEPGGNGDDDGEATAPAIIAVRKLSVTDPSVLTTTPPVVDSTLQTTNSTSASLNGATVLTTPDPPVNTTATSVIHEEGNAHNLTRSADQESKAPTTPDTSTDRDDNADSKTTLPSANSTRTPATGTIPTMGISKQPVREKKMMQSMPKQTAAATTVESSKVIVYRDSKEGWKMMESEKLIQLGYMENELHELLPDALAIIIEEQIRRPRTLGLPAPWRLGPGQTQSELQVVANGEKAQVLLDSLRTNEDEIVPTKATKERRTRIAVVPPQKRQATSTSSDVPQSRSILPNETKTTEILTKPTVGSETDGLPQYNGNMTTVPYSPATSLAFGSGSEVETLEKEEQGTVFLYRDFSKALAFVPVANLTCLGYEVEEIVSMQEEALAIIVSDQVTRPRQGIPLQWKIKDSKAEIQLVESIEVAMVLVDEDKIIRRGQQGIPSQPTPGRPIRSYKDEDGDESIGKASARPKDPNTSQRQKRRDKMDEPAFGKSTPGNTPRQPPPRQEKDEDPPDDPQRRSRRRDSGSSKRIYNARELQNRRVKPALADPPDPNSPIWVDMDTFRTLLRNEAELRLRILGDDWASTVKQESEWRLDLYKKWLWTLHNGVGDSIVPPSRYERARKLKQQMWDSDPESSRSQPQSESPLKSSKPRSRDKRK